MSEEKILNKYIELINKGYCCACNELNCIDNFPQKKIANAISNLQQENKQLKEELQKADSITQSCIFEGKEESTINFRECLNTLALYKEVIEEVREYATNEMRIVNDNEYHKLLQILDKVK